MALHPGVLGDALLDASTAYLSTINKLPDERLTRRKSELDVETAEEKLASERREAAAGGKPISTQWGLYTIDPTTNRYKLELPRPDQPRKPFAKEVELELMLDWSTSGDPYKEDIAKAYLDKAAAPGRQVDIRSRQADTRSRQVDAQVQHLQKQEGYWQSRADEAKRHNSVMEGIYRRKAQQVSGELGSLIQAQEWEKSGTPEQQEAARRYLQGKDVVIQREERQQDLQPGKVQKQELDIATAEEKLAQLKTRSEFLEPKLKEDLDLQIERVKQLKARGAVLGPYLDAQIRRLEEQIVASQERRNRPSGGSGSEVTVPHGPTGPSSRYRGADVARFNEAIIEGVERLTPMSEADATAEVSRQPPGPRRDGYIEAWRSKFPGKVFRPTPNITPFPEPRRPSSGRRGDRDRESALTQPDTALDTQARQRFGKKYVELDENQKAELDEASGQSSVPTAPAPTSRAPAPPAATPPAPAAKPGPAPKPGSPEHRAYTTYRTELVDVPHELAVEAWEAIKKSGTTDEKQAFRRAYREHFGGELR